MIPDPDSPRRVLLAVFAHPDDESFGPGGTLARYAAEGAEVWLVCATDGNAGTVDAAMLAGYTSTGQLRAAELCCAAQTLGLDGVDWLGYRDSGMAGAPENTHPDSLFRAPLDEVAGKIVASIRRHRPQVIICDNEFGGYGHPDHIKLHRATRLAFDAAADPGRYPEAGPPYRATRLYYPAFSAGWLKPLVRLMPLIGRDPRRFGRNHDIDLVQMLGWQSPAHVKVDVRPHLDTKLAASACHRSQGGPAEMLRRVPRWLMRQILGSEAFTQGYPSPKPGGRRGRGLFPDGS
jgi:N-acetyl-1-D-myo-inositol-2-amino-2-deoxy-alpha-D-glucopyranoside deacetylase/mycothiol S-conjugate amidase